MTGEDLNLFSSDDAIVGKPKPFRPQTTVSGAPPLKATAPIPSGNELTSEPRESGVSGQRDIQQLEYKKERNPNTEINLAIEEFLWTIKETLPVHSVAMYWVNRSKKQFILESMVSDSQNFITSERLPYRPDCFLTQIAEHKVPVLKFRLSAEQIESGITYYTQTEKISSFLGVPVFFEGDLCGILFADSLKPDAFDGHVIGRFNRYASIMDHFIYIFSKKEELEFVEKFQSCMISFISEMQRLKNVERLYEEIMSIIPKAFEFTYLALTGFGDDGKFVVQRVTNNGYKEYIPVRSEVSIDESLVGTVMKSLNSVVIKSTDGTMDNRVRFHPTENLLISGSLLCVPIYSSQRSYGAMILEYDVKNWYTQTHAKSLEQLGFVIGMMLETIMLEDTLDIHRVYDESTGIYDKSFFFSRSQVELTRAKRNGFEICLLVFEIDRWEELVEKYSESIIQSVAHQFSKILKLNLRPYDSIGRIKKTEFAAMMVHTDANTSFLVAEKIREQLASSPILATNGGVPVTISIGISRFKKESSTLETMVQGAYEALNRAKEIGGNNVKTN